MKLVTFLAAIGLSTLTTALFGAYLFVLERLGILVLSIGPSVSGSDVLYIGEMAYVAAGALWIFFFAITLVWGWRLESQGN